MLRPNQYFQCLGLISIYFVYASQRIQGIWKQVLTYFKLCRSLLHGNKLHREVESCSSEAKIVRIRAESLKTFPSRPEKGINVLSFFALEGKIEQRIRISARKRPCGPGLLKQQCPALTSSIESYNKHLKTPQKRRNRLIGQQKSGKVTSFT